MTAVPSEARYQILELLKRKGVMTVDQFAKEFELSRTAMRAHLLRLEEQHLIERAAPEADGPGRPPLAFRVTDRGGAVLPSDDTAVLTRLLAFLEREGSAELVRSFFSELWDERLNEYAQQLGGDDAEEFTLDRRLAALERVLELHNFMPLLEVTSSPDGERVQVLVQECNCPLPAAVRATHIPCQLESAFLGEVLGTGPVRVVIASSARQPCRFEFELAARAKPCGDR